MRLDSISPDFLPQETNTENVLCTNNHEWQESNLNNFPSMLIFGEGGTSGSVCNMCQV